MPRSPRLSRFDLQESERQSSSGVARSQFLGEHIDINKLLLINIYFNRDLYYVVALYTNGHDRIGRFCSYQLNRASSLWTFLYVVTIINEHAHNFWGNIVPPTFPQRSPNVPPMFPRSYATESSQNALPLKLLLWSVITRTTLQQEISRSSYCGSAVGSASGSSLLLVNLMSTGI